ncbi:MAG: hypothetical protein N2515_05655, partial [Deltaproteobacteria bacterium]|nr:hypothetical protein [Deltaproteobacteria bacterium]
IDLPDFLGIPASVSPLDGTPLPGDRVLRWELSAGGAEADFFVVFVVGGDGNPAWEHFVPGNVYEAPIPDLSSIPMLEDIAPGEIVWGVYAIRIPGFVFNEFSYRYLNERYWSHVASNTFTMLR